MSKSLKQLLLATLVINNLRQHIQAAFPSKSNHQQPLVTYLGSISLQHQSSKVNSNIFKQHLLATLVKISHEQHYQATSSSNTSHQYPPATYTPAAPPSSTSHQNPSPTYSTSMSQQHQSSITIIGISKQYHLATLAIKIHHQQIQAAPPSDTSHQELLTAYQSSTSQQHAFRVNPPNSRLTLPNKL